MTERDHHTPLNKTKNNDIDVLCANKTARQNMSNTWLLNCCWNPLQFVKILIPLFCKYRKIARENDLQLV